MHTPHRSQNAGLRFVLVLSVLLAVSCDGIIAPEGRLDVLVSSSGYELGGKKVTGEELTQWIERAARADEPGPVAISLVPGSDPDLFVDVLARIGSPIPIELPMSPSAVERGRRIGVPPAFVSFGPERVRVAVGGEPLAGVPSLDAVFAFLVGAMVVNPDRPVALLSEPGVSEERRAAVVDQLGRSKVRYGFVWTNDGFAPLELPDPDA